MARALRHASARSPVATAGSATAPDRPPDDLAALTTILDDDAHLAAERALLGSATLRDIARTLDEARVPWLVWKGPALSVLAWGEIGLRHSDDLDIVVSRSHRDAAHAALLRAGWRRRHRMSARQEHAIHAGSAAYPLLRDDDPLVELHWRFSSPRYPEAGDVVTVHARAERVVLGGRSYHTPGSGDALILLAAHATKHGWSQAEEVLSFARLAQRSPDALASAWRMADDRGIGTVVALAVRLARDLTGVALPIPAGRSVDQPNLDRMAAASISRMAAGDGAWRPTHRWALEWIQRPVDRARYLTRALFDPTMQEWLAIELPDPLVACYRIVRPARLFWRALRR